MKLIGLNSSSTWRFFSNTNICEYCKTSKLSVYHSHWNEIMCTNKKFTFRNKIKLVMSLSLNFVRTANTACPHHLACVFPFNVRSYFVWRNKVLKCPISFSPLIQIILAKDMYIGAFPGLKFIFYRVRLFFVTR